MNSMSCDVFIGVEIPNVEDSSMYNFKKKCNKNANYLVKPKGVNDFSFLCCDKCSKLFSHTEYNFTRIK